MKEIRDIRSSEFLPRCAGRRRANALCALAMVGLATVGLAVLPALGIANDEPAAKANQLDLSSRVQLLSFTRAMQMKVHPPCAADEPLWRQWVSDPTVWGRVGVNDLPLIALGLLADGAGTSDQDYAYVDHLGVQHFSQVTVREAELLCVTQWTYDQSHRERLHVRVTHIHDQLRAAQGLPLANALLHLAVLQPSQVSEHITSGALLSMRRASAQPELGTAEVPALPMQQPPALIGSQPQLDWYGSLLFPDISGMFSPAKAQQPQRAATP